MMPLGNILQGRAQNFQESLLQAVENHLHPPRIEVTCHLEEASMLDAKGEAKLYLKILCI